MIKIFNLDNEIATNKGYGGHSGSKKGISINNDDYLLKYPKSTKSMNVEGLSYTTTPLSEYIGSHIYEILGIETHETILGISNNKLVVACKDFLKNTEVIIDYNAIKNNYDEKIEKFLERNSSKFNIYDDLDEVIYIMNHNEYFKKVPELKDRFWDMFVIDAFISNNDRNEANWGLIYDRETNTLRLAPVYDNGASFYGKSNDEKLEKILNDENKFKQMTYDSCVSAFTKDGKIINPLKYIEKMKNEDCNQALLRIYPKIDMDKIRKMFDEIPEAHNNIPVFSNIQKEAYYKTLEYKKEKVFKKVYQKIIENDNKE